MKREGRKRRDKLKDTAMQSRRQCYLTPKHSAESRDVVYHRLPIFPHRKFQALYSQLSTYATQDVVGHDQRVETLRGLIIITLSISLHATE